MIVNQVRVVVDTAKWAAVNKVTLVRPNGAQEASDAPVGVEPGLAGPGAMDGADAEAGKGAGAAASPPSEVVASVVGAADAVAAALARGAESAAAVNGASSFFS